MDYRVTGQGVAVSEVLFDQTVEQSIDAEFTLPDYCPDISRVLKCRLIPNISNRTLNGSTLSIEGTACITLIYCDESGSICSYDYQTPFSRAMDVGGACDACASLFVKVRAESVNCRAVTSRKLDIHSATSIRAKVVCRKETEVVCDVDGPDVQLLKGMAPATNPLSVSEKYLVLEEEIDLSDDQPSIRSVLRADGRVVSAECKVISNKAVVKGEMMLNALYCPDDGRKPECLEYSLPISQIVDIDGINDTCDCEVSAEVVSLELKPRTGMSGEARSFILQAKVYIAISAFCNEDVPVIYDAYSTKYEAKTEKSNIMFEKMICTINENYLCKKSLEFTEGSISSIIDLWCDSQVGGVTNEKNTLVVTGTVQICMLAYDTENMPVYFERPVDYEYRYDMDKTPANMRCDPQIAAVASSHTVSSTSKVEVRVELGIVASVFELSQIPLITSIEIDEESPRTRNDDTALVIYYADAGEKVWDIARRYNTSPAEIAGANDLTDDALTGSQMLLIPCV